MRSTLPVLLLASLAAGCVEGDVPLGGDTTPYVGERVVSMTDNAFSPATLRVAESTIVVWRNDGEIPHTATHKGGDFDSKQMDPGDTYRHVFPFAGTYTVDCLYHAGDGMTMRVTVE